MENNMNNKLAFSEVLASLYFYLEFVMKYKIKRDEIIKKIGGDLTFWIPNAVFTANQNRVKMVYELILKYFPLLNVDYDEVFNSQDKLKRPSSEIQLFYEELEKYYL